MANLNGFDANQVEPNAGFDPIPADKYVAMVTGSQTKPTKNGDGSYLELEFTVLEGQYKDRKVWDRLCLNHPKPETVKFARSNLSALCRAVGVLQPKDSCDLHNLPLVITVRCKKREDTGDITNEVKGYAARKSAVAPAPQASQTSTVPPWRR
jgi:hypothetical protein